MIWSVANRRVLVWVLICVGFGIAQLSEAGPGRPSTARDPKTESFRLLDPQKYAEMRAKVISAVQENARGLLKSLVVAELPESKSPQEKKELLDRISLFLTFRGDRRAIDGKEQGRRIFDYSYQLMRSQLTDIVVLKIQVIQKYLALVALSGNPDSLTKGLSPDRLTEILQSPNTQRIHIEQWLLVLQEALALQSQQESQLRAHHQSLADQKAYDQKYGADAGVQAPQGKGSKGKKAASPPPRPQVPPAPQLLDPMQLVSQATKNVAQVMQMLAKQERGQSPEPIDIAELTPKIEVLTNADRPDVVSALMGPTRSVDANKKTEYFMRVTARLNRMMAGNTLAKEVAVQGIETILTGANDGKPVVIGQLGPGGTGKTTIIEKALEAAFREGWEVDRAEPIRPAAAARVSVRDFVDLFKDAWGTVKGTQVNGKTPFLFRRLLMAFRRAQLEKERIKSGTLSEEQQKYLALQQELADAGKPILFRIVGHLFSQSHQISALTGASAGHIGFDEPSGMARDSQGNMVPAKPSAMLARENIAGYKFTLRNHVTGEKKEFLVFMIDEIEKAHPDILKFFYDILEGREQKLSNGTTFQAKDALIVINSNAGEEALKKFGFEIAPQLKAIRAKPNGGVFDPTNIAIVERLEQEFGLNKDLQLSLPKVLRDKILNGARLTPREVDEIASMIAQKEAKTYMDPRTHQLVFTDSFRGRVKNGLLGYLPYDNVSLQDILNIFMLDIHEGRAKAIAQKKAAGKTEEEGLFLFLSESLRNYLIQNHDRSLGARGLMNVLEQKVLTVINNMTRTQQVSQQGQKVILDYNPQTGAITAKVAVDGNGRDVILTKEQIKDLVEQTYAQGR